MLKVQVSQIPFEHYSPKYKCCCGTTHVKQGTAVTLIFTVLMLIFSVWHLTFGNQGTTGMLAIVEWIWVPINIAGCVFLYLGLKRERKDFLLPFMGMQVLQAASEIVLFLISIVSIFSSDNGIEEVIRGYLNQREDDPTKVKEIDVAHVRHVLSATMALVTVVSVVLCAKFFHVTYKCYRYFADYERAKATHFAQGFSAVNGV